MTAEATFWWKKKWPIAVDLHQLPSLVGMSRCLCIEQGVLFSENSPFMVLPGSAPKRLRWPAAGLALTGCGRLTFCFVQIIFLNIFSAINSHLPSRRRTDLNLSLF